MGNAPSDFDHEKRVRELSGVHGSGNLGSILAAADFGENPLAEPLVPKTEETKKQQQEKLTENEIVQSETIIKKEVENEAAKESFHGSGNLESILVAADIGENPLAEPLVPKTEETKKQQKEKLTENKIVQSETILKKEVENETAKEVEKFAQADKPKVRDNVRSESTDNIKTAVSNQPDTSKLILEDDVEPIKKEPLVTFENKTDATYNTASAENEDGADSRTNTNNNETTPTENSIESTHVPSSGRSFLDIVCCRK